MVTREELYQQWGPMLLEAITEVIKDEINILRTEAGLSKRTDTQLKTAIQSKLDGLTIYPWMIN